jgi:hypothetical protein
MAHEMDTETANGFHVNRFAQVIERTGLPLIGALCRFLVAELAAKANIVEINSVGILCSVILYGSVGFLFGNRHSFVAFRRALLRSFRWRFGSED